MARERDISSAFLRIRNCRRGVCAGQGVRRKLWQWSIGNSRMIKHLRWFSQKSCPLDFFTPLALFIQALRLAYPTQKKTKKESRHWQNSCGSRLRLVTVRYAWGFGLMCVLYRLPISPLRWHVEMTDGWYLHENSASDVFGQQP